MIKDQTKQEGVNRWQWPPIAACIVAGLFLIFLALPGVLSFPQPGEPAVASAGEIDIARKQNEILRQKIDGLKEAIDNGLCVADGELTIPDGDLTPLIRRSLPPTPANLQATCAGAAAGGGTVVGDLLQSSVILVVSWHPTEAGTIRGMGSGFFVGPNEILTNAHNVLDEDTQELAGPVSIYSPELGRMDAEVTAYGGSAKKEQVDLAVLKVTAANADYFVLADTLPSDKIRAAGFPGQIITKNEALIEYLNNPTGTLDPLYPVLSNGNVIAVQSEANNIDWVYHDAYIAKGNSGGPIVDECGRVVGVNTLIESDLQDKATVSTIPKAIALPTIQDFLRSKSDFEIETSDAPLPGPA